MLVNTMTLGEIHKEFFVDLDPVLRTATDRLIADYARERKRKGIKPQAQYPRFYEIRSRRKNRWLIPFMKQPSATKFDPKNPMFLPVTYYYTHQGIRVLTPYIENGEITGGIVIYNGHVFTRYNERMKLGLTEPLDKIKHFFANNGGGSGRVTPNEDRIYVSTLVKDGFLLGELQPHGFIFKTFISYEEMKDDQKELKEELLQEAMGELEELLNQESFNRAVYNEKANVLAAVQPISNPESKK